MYCNFYGFSEKPFDVTPDPKFLYLTPGHREMLAALTYGIRERRGFITIVGEVGTGKTTLLNVVLDRLYESTKVACIFNADGTFLEIDLAMALIDFGLANSNETSSKIQAIHRLNDFAIQQLTTGGNVVLIVDEAQNLDRRSMEGLRLLSNLETRKHKLIQIVLSGQPELDAKLNRPELRNLAQRISLRRYITTLSEKETYDYIHHRLGVANYSGSTLFSPRARKMIWEYSRGVPRKINILCDNVLLLGYALRKKTIRASVVAEAIRDLSPEYIKHAEKEYQAERQRTAPEAPTVRVAPPPRRASTRPAMERYEELKTALLTRHANGSIKTILFAGTTHGDGSSTTAINFATALTRDSQLKVLLVDVNLRSPSLHDVFKIDHTQGLYDILAGNRRMACRLKKVGPGNLYVLPCGGKHFEPVALLESRRFDQTLKMMQEKFDYVILDTPPAPGFSESRVLCSKVDGVVLVIESGKTRRHVALKAKKHLEEAGGKLLGVVLNKRRHYIPEWVYKRL